MTDQTCHHACAVARPGDTLIIGFAGSTSPENLKQVVESLTTNLPDGVRVSAIDNVRAFQVVRGVNR